MRLICVLNAVARIAPVIVQLLEVEFVARVGGDLGLSESKPRYAMRSYPSFDNIAEFDVSCGDHAGHP